MSFASRRTKTTPRAPVARPGRAFRPGDVRGLEARALLSTFTVTNTADSGPGSLRQAILDVDGSTSTTPDTIAFNIPGSGPFTISPTSALPAITHPAVVNGYTQPGAHPNTLSRGDNAAILIDLDGSAAGGVDGLTVTAGQTTIKGLAVTRWSNGIHLTTAGNDVVAGDFLGTDTTGTTGLGNSSNAVLVDGISATTVGGTSPAARDLISGNGQGVGLVNGATGDRVDGNFLGTDATGTRAIGNGIAVFIQNAPANTVGGTASGAGNLLSGNGDPVQINGSGSSGTVVQGNLIGTDVTGTLALGNAGVAVQSFDAGSLVIGGASTAARNVIAANGGAISIINQGSGASNNSIRNNYIGVDVTGTRALGNGGDGIGLTDSGNNTIVGNVISNNTANGIFESSQIAGNNTIQGNLIGTDATGTVAMGNGLMGVYLGSSGNLVGGTASGAGNVISANGYDGVRIDFNTTTGNVVRGNLIGTDAYGTHPLGNHEDGVRVQGGASNNKIGGTAAGAGNVIAFNTDAGVVVGNNTADTSINNPILSNSIHDNGGLGIDLADDGVTPNDPGDADTGPNQLQNDPVLTGASSTATGTTITGTLNSTPGSKFTVQFFSNPAPDPSGFGEGQTYLGSITVTTDALGNAAFTFTSAVSVPAGQVVSATATDANGNTSEFSADVPVVAAPAAASASQPAAATSAVLIPLVDTTPDATAARRKSGGVS